MSNQPARTSGSVLPPYLEGIYAPVVDEVDADHLAVVGQLPDELAGLFAQNGPNPSFPPGVGHSWFDGDGMVHGVEVRDGVASYRNRFVATPGLAEDRAAGAATYVGSLAGPGAGRRHKNVSNTDVVFHAGRLLSLWWEGGLPYELTLPGLDTLGPCDFGGTLTLGMTSHVKVDHRTGELFFFDWATRAPFLQVGVIGADGMLAGSRPVELPGPRVQHDIALTDRYVLVFDLSMSLDPARRSDPTIGFRFDDELPSRIGLVDRALAGDSPVRWFEIEPCWIWHTLCAWDDGDEVVLCGARIGSPTRVDKHGRSHEDLPMVDDEYRFDSHPHEWRLHLGTGQVRERQLDDALVEFPRVDDRRICSGARYGYFAELGAGHRTLKAEALLKYDLASGARQRVSLPSGWYANEPCFAPRSEGSAEDDGWILSYVTDEASGGAELWVLDASSFDPEPVARVILPQRKPQGFHTRWVPAPPAG